MCGGIIEVGIIAAVVGYIGKRMHKCKCKCHNDSVDTCKHCSDQPNNKEHNCGGFVNIDSVFQKEKNVKFKKKTLTYKIIQYILGIIVLGGIIMTCIGVHKNMCKHEHTENCKHHVLKH